MTRSRFTAQGMVTSFAVALALALAACALKRSHGLFLALQLTGRWSFCLFWLAYAGSSLARVLGSPRRVLNQGRDFGLAYASAQLVHVGLVCSLYATADRAPVTPGEFIFLGIGVIFTYLLAALSFKPVTDAVGAGVARITRRIGMEYILVVFAYDFVWTPIRSDQTDIRHVAAYLPFALLLLAAPMLRALAAFDAHRLASG